MITLELNYYRTGTMPNGREWHTATVGKLGSIHVHNSNGVWEYRLTTTRSFELYSRKGYATKEEAYCAALSGFTEMARQALDELMVARSAAPDAEPGEVGA